MSFVAPAVCNLVPLLMKGMWTIVLVLLFAICDSGSGDGCAARETNSSSIICVCNSIYCDNLPQIDDNLSEGTYQYFASTKGGLRLSKESGNFIKDPSVNLLYIIIDKSKTYQTIKGFGGAFTDAAGINIAQLPEAAQEKLLRAFFSADGAEFNMGRVPVGGSDFSTRGYTYADDSSNNGTLDGFSLQEEDYNYKIPFIVRANELCNGTLKLLASAWSAPAWMKTIEKLNAANSFLKQEYYQLWADYYIKFFEAYAEYNVTFWALTTQNEPSSGRVGLINSIAWNVDQLITWLTKNLGPTIRNSRFSDLDILIFDDQTARIGIVQQYFNNPEALNYIDGVAVHWYLSLLVPHENLEAATTNKKPIYLLMTEASAGILSVLGMEPAVILGSWERAHKYAKEMLNYLNQGSSVGWIDWNLVLDEAGGPNWVNNHVDAPIIVNATIGEFYKQPSYYVLAHFSKFVPRGSVRVRACSSPVMSGVGFAAFLRPDGAVTLIVHNEDLFSKTLAIYDIDMEGYINLELPATAIVTLVYK